MFRQLWYKLFGTKLIEEKQFSMPASFVEKEFERFLGSDTPEVLAITGNWGVGKTYAWQKWAKDHKSSIKCKQYGYVSLFGLDSLDSLKQAISQRIGSTSVIGKEFSAESIMTDPGSALGKFANLGKLGKLASFAKIPFVKDLGSIVADIAFQMVDKSVICIDDFERKSDKLTIKDVFGLICYLRDEMNCKVVLIFNEQKVDAGIKSDYEAYFEKCVDCSITFKPSVKEIISKALNLEDDTFKKVGEFCERLQIDNFRIIHRIKRLVSILLPHMKGYDIQVLEHALHTLTLFIACKYSNDRDRFPTLEFACLTFEKAFDSRASGKGKAPEGKVWAQILSDYGFTNFDKFDLEIKGVIEDGYVNEETFAKAASDSQERYRQIAASSAYQVALNLYEHCFDDNVDEVIKAITNALISESSVGWIGHLNENVVLFRKLERDSDADSLIADFLGGIEPSLIGSYEQMEGIINNVSDDALKKELKKLQLNHCDPEEFDAADFLMSVSISQSWGPRKVEQLAELSEENFISLFKRVGENQRNVIRAAQMLGRSADSIVEGKHVYEEIERNVNAALVSIGKSSRLNRLRVAKYGIEIPDKPGETQ